MQRRLARLAARAAAAARPSLRDKVLGVPGRREREREAQSGLECVSI